MSENKPLTQKQQYLQFLIPRLNDTQIEDMLAAVNGKALIMPPSVAPGNAGRESSFPKPQAETSCTPPTKPPSAGPKPEKAQEDPYRELMNMVGCNDAKQQLTAMIADFRMRKLAAARGRNSARAYYHAVFTGNPGSAKTTCARLYAKALAREGITKNDHFEELSRSKIVDKYVGSTAQNVRRIFERNADGVIFIDEAYTLCDSDPAGKNNFGIEAINELIVCMENHPETVVIFAGYPDRMEEFLSSNPGLRSRIPYTVTFSDYTTEELVAISRLIAGEQGYEIAESAVNKLSAIYDCARNQKDFGNGRYVRNLVEAAVRTKGLRLGVMEAKMDDLMDHTRYTDSMLFSLDENCFEVTPEPPEKPRRRIGFCA